MAYFRLGQTRFRRPHPSFVFYVVVSLIIFFVLKFDVDLKDLLATNEELGSDDDIMVEDACPVPEPLFSDVPSPVQPACMNDSEVMFKMTYGSRLERLNLQSRFWERANCC